MSPPPALACTFASLLAVSVCRADDPPTFGPSGSSGSSGLSGSSGSPDVTTSDPTMSEMSTAGIADTASSTGASDPPGPAAVPCAAIDVLFVVDNSSTMAEEQVRLGAVAPNFIAALAANLPDGEFHVGVISTDSPALAPSATRCGPFASGLGFMTGADVLATSLVCAAQVGVAGSPDERPIDMLLAAVDDLANEPGGLNTDFVRKPSLLVLAIVTDEEDDHEVDPAWGSESDPAGWFTGLTAIKDGFADDIVVLTLVGTPAPNSCPQFQWDGKDGAEIAPRLAEFTGMFRYGRVGDACAPSYDPFFFDAIPMIAEACASFIPVE